MDLTSLEKRLFAHLEKESLILSVVNVGFVLGIDNNDAVLLLEKLTESGKLEKASGEGSAAIYRRTGHATYETTPGSTSVSGSKSSAALYHLLLNAFFPGLGSLIYGRIGLLFVLLLLFGAAVSIIVFLPAYGKLYSILLFVLWWLVGFLASLSLYFKDPWSQKK